MGERVLVVGATRILRPAVEEFVRRGATVLAVARTADALDQLAAEHPGAVDPLPVNYRDTERLGAALRRVPPRPTAALVYAPSAPPATLSTIRAVVQGPLVQLLTSSIAGQDPEQPFSVDLLASPPGEQWYRLVLGWTAERTWHTPEQISAAALTTLATPRDTQLGALRPWAERPGH